MVVYDGGFEPPRCDAESGGSREVISFGSEWASDDVSAIVDGMKGETFEVVRTEVVDAGRRRNSPAGESHVFSIKVGLLDFSQRPSTNQLLLVHQLRM